MSKFNPFFFILTGGPGSGKTTLLQELKKRGYSTVSETGRTIIQEQIDTNGDALPWKNKLLFAQRMLAADHKNYLQHDGAEQPIIFDRGIPDSLGYLRLSKVEEPLHFRKLTQHFRYNKFVFILPAWKAIYKNDSERKQDFILAKETYKVMYKTYLELGYQMVRIPKVSICKRADNIIKTIQTIIKQGKH